MTSAPTLASLLIDSVWVTESSLLFGSHAVVQVAAVTRKYLQYTPTPHHPPVILHP